MRPARVAPAQPYAAHPSELAQPASPPVKQAARGTDWRLIAAAFAAVAGLVGYTQAWPAVKSLLQNPSPARDYLLPESTQPVYVIAGVPVGWFWVLLIATPAVTAAVALMWWASIAWSNHLARTGEQGRGQLRAGQRWPGHTYPTGPLILSGAALLLAAFGVVLRWSAPAADTLPGRLLLVAVLISSGWGYAQFVRWVRARGSITARINTIAYITAPTMGWRELRTGRVKAADFCYPRRQSAYPNLVSLKYSQHPRDVGEDLLAEISEILEQVLGRRYTLDHDLLTRTLIATQNDAPTEETTPAAQALLAPLVAAWFDPAAEITSVTVRPSEPATAPEADPALPAPIDDDELARQISEFTVEFVYNLKVSTPYRRGVIESAISDSLGGSWESDWSLASRRVRFIRSPGLPTLVDPPLEFPTVTKSTIRKLYSHTAIPFAVDAYGNVISWDFKASPHFLIAGPTSTGKTSLLMTVATQCAARGINVVWIDPKGFDSPGLRDYPNVSLVTSGLDDDGMVGHVAVLRFIADTMRDRLTQVKINPNRANDFDPIVVIADEFSNLVMELNRLYLRFKNTKIDKGRPPIEDDVGTILRTARAVGIHMAIGIQRPDTLFISGEARDNTALRVAMGRLRSKEAAIMMFADPTAGTRLQPGVKGRGTVQLPDGRFREIQVFYTPVVPATDEQNRALTEHERSILARLADVDSFWPRRVVDSALRDYDPDDPDSVMSFKQIRESPIVMASEHPDLDPLSDEYVPPRSAGRRSTMDDDHPGAADSPPLTAGLPLDEGLDLDRPARGPFSDPMDGFADDYLPDIEDEYGPPIPASAHELQHGDLVNIAEDDTTAWRYVYAEPYCTDDADGSQRLVIPYRDIDDGQVAGDIEVDPYTVLEVRQLNMQ